MQHRIPFFLVLRLPEWWFQIPLEGLRFVKTLVTFAAIYATDPLLQNMTRIVRLRWLTVDIFEYKPGDHAELRAQILQNQTSLSHALTLNRSQWFPIFFFISDTEVTHYLTAVKFLKNYIDWKSLAILYRKTNNVIHGTSQPIRSLKTLYSSEII